MSHNYPYRRPSPDSDLRPDAGSYSSSDRRRASSNHNYYRPPQESFSSSYPSSSFNPSSSSSSPSSSSRGAQWSQDVALSILSSCGLEPSDLALLAEMPEDVLTVESLPRVLQQIKGKRGTVKPFPPNAPPPSSSSSSYPHSSAHPLAVGPSTSAWDHPCRQLLQYPLDHLTHNPLPSDLDHWGNTRTSSSVRVDPPPPPSSSSSTSSYMVDFHHRPGPSEYSKTTRNASPVSSQDYHHRPGPPEYSRTSRDTSPVSSYQHRSGPSEYGKTGRDACPVSSQDQASLSLAGGDKRTRPSHFSQPGPADYRSAPPLAENHPKTRGGYRETETSSSSSQPTTSLPSKQEALDFHGTCPPAFPYSCCLCNITVMSEKVWIKHINGANHADGQLSLLQRFPNWDCRMETVTRADNQSEKRKNEEDSGRQPQPTNQESMTQPTVKAQKKTLQKGKVVCVKFPAQSVDEAYLRKLTEPFGKIVKVVMFPSLAFVELGSVDQAKDMVKFHTNYPPTVNGEQMEFSISKTFSFLQSSRVVSFTPAPTGENGKSDLISIVKRFGSPLYTLFLPSMAFVEMKNAPDAQKMVDFYSSSTLRINDDVIRVSFSGEYKSLMRVPSARRYEEEPTERTRSSSREKEDKTMGSKRRRSSKGREEEQEKSSRERKSRTRSKSREKSTQEKRTRTRSKSREKSRETTSREKRSRSRSRDKFGRDRRTRSRSKSREKSSREKRSRSRSRDKFSKDRRSRSRSKSREKSSREKRSRSRSRDKFSKDRRSRSRSKSKEKSSQKEGSRSKSRSRGKLAEPEKTESTDTKSRTDPDPAPVRDSQAEAEEKEESEEEAEMSAEESDIEGMEVIGEDGENLEDEDMEALDDADVEEENEEQEEEGKMEEAAERTDSSEGGEEEETKDGEANDREQQQEKEEPDFPVDLENCITLDELEEDQSDDQDEEVQAEHESPSTRVVYFKNLPLRSYPEAEFVSLVRDFGTAVRFYHKPPSCGFIEMSTSSEALRAVKELTSKCVTFYGSRLVVQISSRYRRLHNGWPVPLDEPSGEEKRSEHGSQRSSSRRSERQNRNRKSEGRKESSRETPEKEPTSKKTPEEKSTSKKVPEEESTTKKVPEEESTTKTKKVPEEESTTEKVPEEESTNKTKKTTEGKSTSKKLPEEKSTTKAKKVLEEESTSEKTSEKKPMTKKEESTSKTAQESLSKRAPENESMSKTANKKSPEKVSVDKHASENTSRPTPENEAANEKTPDESYDTSEKTCTTELALNKSEEDSAEKDSAAKKTPEKETLPEMHQEQKTLKRKATHDNDSVPEKKKNDSKSDKTKRKLVADKAPEEEKSEIHEKEGSEEETFGRGPKDSESADPPGSPGDPPKPQTEQTQASQVQVEQQSGPAGGTAELQKPPKPVGAEFVRPVVGYFCHLCQLIYADEDEAKVQHCSSLTHYRKYQEKTGRDPWAT